MMQAEKRGSLVKFITFVTSGGRDLARGTAHAYIISDIYWEKRDGKTAGLSNLNRHMLIQARMARNVSILRTSDLSHAELCVRRAKSLPPDVMHVMNFTRLPRFSAYIIEKLGGAWVCIMCCAVCYM